MLATRNYHSSNPSIPFMAKNLTQIRSLKNIKNPQKNPTHKINLAPKKKERKIKASTS
jgi:hypothetical protein